MTDQKRILILTWHFFPDPQVAGVRMTQFCRFLPEFGWQPMVLTRDWGYQATAEQWGQAVHPSVVHEYLGKPARPTKPPAAATQIQPPHAGRSWRKSLRWQASKAADSLCVPDRFVLSWRQFHAQTLEAVRQFQPHVIMTTSPPHSTHSMGLWLARATGLPWIADFRDPYLIDERFHLRGLAKLRWQTHRRFERAIYENAAVVLHAIPLHARWARRAFPWARARIVTLTNGYPPELADGSVQPIRTPHGRRSVRVIGFAGDEPMLKLAHAVAHLVSRGMDVELRVVGAVPTTAQAMERLLGDRLILTGPLSHPNALTQMAGADLLVSYLSPQRSRTKGLSGKLFEYMATGKPILEINPTSPDRHLLRELPVARTLQSPTTEKLACAIADLLDHGHNISDASRERLGRYNRRALTGRLAAKLDEIAGFDLQPGVVTGWPKSPQ